ncbi:MAG: thiosulfate/3-mercaptopyruvate [Beijerinckiaceae bacterium]|nr:MAG: thiosulfate/3-mercaptopyruvate [Beijerinckiaceae bacterium]
MAEAVTPLVSAAWLAARAGDAGLVRIDLRLAADGGRAAYEAAHVPGAIFSDYAADGWRRKVGDVPGLLPTDEHLATLFARLGIGGDRHIVLIPSGTSANDLAASARAYWTLKLTGHDRVSILDGGTRGWIAGGNPVEQGAGPSGAGTPGSIGTKAQLRADAAATLVAQRTGSHALIDARSASYFAGLEKASEAKAAGHIPGAISADYARLFDAATGRLKPVEELRALLAAVPEGPVINYCNTGHTAALNWFVLSEVFGRPGVVLYDGSMTDWTQDANRPVARGA